jgi:hypothetical protein
MCSKRQPQNLTFGLHEYIAWTKLWKDRWWTQKKLVTPNSLLNTICQYSFTCVCFAQLPFCKKRENCGRHHYFHSKFHNNCKTHILK